MNVIITKTQVHPPQACENLTDLGLLFRPFWLTDFSYPVYALLVNRF